MQGVFVAKKIMQIRPAIQSDQKTITRLIHDAGINPMSLDWHRFVIAEDSKDPKGSLARKPFGSIIGIGQIKQHGDGSRELASIAVIPERRQQGIASEIIRHLLTQDAERGVMYLTCRAQLETFYHRFGFKKIGRDEMPPYFRRIHRIGSIFARLAGTELLVMKK